jgi:hypothetical protein
LSRSNPSLDAAHGFDCELVTGDHELATAYIPDGKLSLFVGMSVFKKLKTQNCSKDLKVGLK